jgi:signal transduction histidine kinase
MISHAHDRRIKRIHALRGIIIGRWFLIFGLGLLGLTLKVLGITLVSLTFGIWVTLIAIPAVYNLLYTVLLSRGEVRLSDRALNWFSLAQVVVDQVVFTLIIYFTGGVESVGYILYFFPILTATILYSDLKIVSFTIGTVVLYTTLIILEFNNLLPHYARYAHDPGFFRNAEVTLANTLSVDLILLFVAMFSVFINRIIRDRELDIMIERDKVKSILNSLEDGIIMLDASKQVTLINPPARDILRFYGEFAGPELRKEDFPKAFARLIQVIREQPDAKRLAQEVVVQEGQHKTIVQVDSIPIFASDGSIISWVKVLHDVTRDRELDEIKSDFISVAAHQLRTPLAALKWFFKMMSEGDAGDISDKQKGLLDRAYDRTNEIIEIVNNLLDISEIEEGRFPYQFTEGNLMEVLHAVVKSGQVDADHKGVTLVFRPESETLPPVEMDQQKIRMAIQNLVDNALKYSRKGDTVELAAAVKNNRLFISVKDEGIGIPKEQQPKIFSKFFRGSNAKEKETTGSGLGLYIVKNVVERHRGQIWFDSRENDGTTFYVSLPIARRHLPATSASTSSGSRKKGKRG